MTLAVALFFMFGVVFMCVTHYLTQRRLEGMVRDMMERDEARQTAVFKQQKASERTVTQADRAVRKLADQLRATHEDVRLTHERVDRLLADERVKRLVDNG